MKISKLSLPAIILLLGLNRLIAQNPVIHDQFTADPTARVFNGKVYVYPSHDIRAREGMGRPGWFCMADYHVFSSSNLTDWTDHGVIVKQNRVNWVDSTSYSMWAPDCIFRNGKYYFYFPANSTTEVNGRKMFGIGVAVADKPEGPYTPQPEPVAGVHGIDPNVFIDKDGQAYLYWAMGKLYAARLKENMLELASEPQVVKDFPEKGLVEGPWLFERNGIYYMTYPHVEKNIERLEYAIGNNPMGPFSFAGVIMDESPMNCWTNHQSLAEYNGQWYLFYHQNAYSPKFDKNRAFCIDSLFFNADGTIRKVIPTNRGVGLTNASGPVEIDRYSAISETGATVEFIDTSYRFNGWKTIFSKRNAWIKYNAVDFGTTRSETVQVKAMSVAGAKVEIRLNNAHGPLLAEVSIPGNNQWNIVTSKVNEFLPGVQNLVIVSTTDQPVEIDWVGFKYPFQNPDLSAEERARDLISRLTLQEKATLMCDQSDAIPRLGIKKFNWWSEALHGYANNDNVTVFPEPIGMAASFNDKLVFDIFNAVSDEGRAKYNQWINSGNQNKRFLSLSVWTPNVNIFRDPRWGRGQETYGEDPYLTSRMGVQVVKGLQGPPDAKYRKLLACAKHYAVHSGPEWSRHSLNLNNVSPRELYETYLPAFKALVQDGDVRQVMCAYQRLDDEPCCGNTRLLQRILRDEWGFKYMVVSDCGAITDFFNSHKVSSTPVHAASKGVLAGTDVECVWENYPYKTLPEGVNQGLIKEEDIDRSLMRVLKGRFELGDFDNDSIVPWAQIPPSVLNNEKHRQLALEMARQTMTLLQNNNSILPLSKSSKKIAVIGPNANDKVMLWGNYNGTPVRTISILDGIKTKLPESKILYDKGCDLVEDKVTNTYFGQLSFEGKKGFQASYWNNPDRNREPVATVQISNPIKMTTAGQHEFASGVKLEGFSALYEAEFTPEVTEDLVFKGGATGHFELVVNGETLRKYDNWRTLPARIPFKVEAGKKYKIEIRYAQLNNWQANIELDFGKEVDVDYTELINKLKGIETVVFVGGISGNLEGEEMPVSYPGFKGGDRTNIELPLVQRNCLMALKAAGKKIIFVNCSGSAIALAPETQSCDAILQAWYAGESGGQAVAEVLFGDYNPSGKLPVTFYKNSDVLRDFEDYSMKGRTYRYTTDYLFPFGFGLSYTRFEIGNATISKASIKPDEKLLLTVPVKNTGKRDGTEIVQVYVRKVNDVEGPIKTLRGFSRVEVPAGKSQQVTIDLPSTSFEFYDWAQRKMAVTPGDYEVLYGNSSDPKDLKTLTVHIAAK